MRRRLLIILSVVAVAGLLALWMSVRRSDRPVSPGVQKDVAADAREPLAAPPMGTSPTPTAREEPRVARPIPPVHSAQATAAASLPAEPLKIVVTDRDRENFEAIEAKTDEIERFTRHRAELEAETDREEQAGATPITQARMDRYVQRQNQIAIEVFGPERAKPFLSERIKIDTPVN